jgi:hypothetical protein
MTKRPDLPELDATARRYVENTGRARLASPGIERFDARPRTRRVGGALAALAALALVAALVAAMLALR